MAARTGHQGTSKGHGLDSGPSRAQRDGLAADQDVDQGAGGRSGRSG
ncbi:hypothetical protein [Kitasatospora sp. NPDC051914]